ncbi:MAG: L,D-transpeptidase family protein [Planctomycetes bacterium]|nr:L,D-transpeptidase family protein [Planctomycetota bacterium]
MHTTARRDVRSPYGAAGAARILAALLGAFAIGALAADGAADPKAAAPKEGAGGEARADRLLREGDELAAREILWKELAGTAAAGDRERLRKKIDRLNRTLLFTTARPKGVPIYRVRPGDSLSRIGRRYGITAELLKRMNALKSDLIRVDDELKVVEGPFDVIIDKAAFRLSVLWKGRLIVQYPVGLGRDGGTPVGAYVAGAKLVEPTWFDRENKREVPFGHPEHPIGTRWITFAETFGIHGTNDPQSVGRAASHGCVRMRNEHVEELFDLVVPERTRIEIIEEAPAAGS